MIIRAVTLINLLIFAIFFANNENVAAQSLPKISYKSQQIFKTGVQIIPLVPTNTGGPVSPINYNMPIVFTSHDTPFCIAIDASDNVYTTSNSTGDLTKYDSNGTVLFTVNAGDIQASEIAVDGMGNIYVSQFTKNCVLKYNSAGKLLATIPGFDDPYGIAFDASNNAYVANYLSGNILKINAYTTSVSVYLTGFVKPYGIVIDDSGNMYVGQQSAGDIIKIARSTSRKTAFASGFNGPRHLNKDVLGNIYAADFGNNAIKKIDPAGKVTTVLDAGLSSPRQAAFDSSGNLFVADYGSNSLLRSAVGSYSINAPLPSGLNFDTATGQITGTPTMPGVLTFTVSAYNAGGTSSTTLTITVVPSELNIAKMPIILDDSLANSGMKNYYQNKIVVHQAVSPNGDGVNDFFFIDGIENYPDNKVIIFNRSGAIVYSAIGYDNSGKVFDGHSSINGHLQPPGTYFYSIECNIDGKVLRKTGFIILKPS